MLYFVLLNKRKRLSLLLILLIKVILHPPSWRRSNHVIFNAAVLKGHDKQNRKMGLIGIRIMPEMICRSQISTENFLHMRYDRTDCALMVSTDTKQANQIADFRAAFETRWMESWYIVHVHLCMIFLLSLGCPDDRHTPVVIVCIWCLYSHAPLAQSVEREIWDFGVDGSSSNGGRSSHVFLHTFWYNYFLFTFRNIWI